MLYYFLVFIGSLLVDLIPFVGPPAWTVMVFFQMRYDLNIWAVIVTGVIGSAMGRYLLSRYMPWLAAKFIKLDKNEDLRFIGEQLNNNGWKIQLFVLLYTLVPLPSVTLFTAAGIAKIRAINIIPSFLVGKFISDAFMVITGDYLASNTKNLMKGLRSWESISGMVLGLIILGTMLFIDWRILMKQKKIRFSFRIWK